MSTQDVAKAFAYGANKAGGNHMATHDGERSSYYLHGSKIIVWDRAEGTFWVSSAGFTSVTTAKAINTVLNACPLVSASLKSWVLTDATGQKAMVGKDGVTLHRRDHGSNGFIWDLGYNTGNAPVIAEPLNASLAPTIGGK